MAGVQLGLLEGAASPASDWCQRWTAGAHSWRHKSAGGFDPARYTVEPIDETTARRYVLAHHYAASYPAARLRFGLLDGVRLVGVAVLGIPTQAAVLSNVFPGLEPYRESLELSRLVLADEVPGNGESWMLGRVWEQARAAGVRGVVSFSDPCPRVVAGRTTFPGHIGVIYQATNAVYTGRGTARTITLLPDGSVLNDRARAKLLAGDRGADGVERRLVALGGRVRRAGERPGPWLAAVLEELGAVRARHRGCHRYAFRLDRRVELAGDRLPYPKQLDRAA